MEGGSDDGWMEDGSTDGWIEVAAYTWAPPPPIPEKPSQLLGGNISSFCHQCPWWESQPVSGYILMSRLSCHLFYEETGGGTQRLGFLLGVSCAPHTLVDPSLQHWEYAEELQLSNIHGGQFWWGTSFDNTVASSEGLYKCRLPHSPSNRLQCGGGLCKWASTLALLPPSVYWNNQHLLPIILHLRNILDLP